MTASPHARPALGLMALALSAGVVIAFVDASPSLNSGGLVVVALVAIAAVVAHAGRHHPWLWALLVGGPTAAAEVLRSGPYAAVAILALAGIGATLGWALAAAPRRGAARA